MRRGVLYAASAYALWGAFPVYFHAVASVPALEILGHRIVWTLLFVALLLSLRRQWGWLGTALRSGPVLISFALSALLVASNWYSYIWTLNRGQVVEGALGFFISPLISVLLGASLLREPMSRWQWLAALLVSAGVAWMGWQLGRMPWPSLIIGATFAAYGLVRKHAPLPPLEGLTLETLLLVPAAAWVLVHLQSSGTAHFETASRGVQILVLLSGPITAVPLLLFTAGAQRIPMSWLGMLQYLGPSLQILIAVGLYHEPFGGARAQGCALIWLGCAVFSADLLLAHRRGRQQRAPEAATIDAPPGA